ncbi:MAG TPA: hypothetical protein VGI46_09590 [Candidatus Acidoferrum sp.]
MNRIRSFAIGTILMFAPSMLAQQTSSNSSGGLPTVEEQLKVLTGKLDLTGDQQTKIKPILQDLHDATQKLMEDKSLSNEERLAKVRPQRMNADSRIRSILNDDQKKKLDQYEQGPHGEMHGSLRGTTQPPRQPPNV